MTLEEMRRVARAQPFVPFAIHLADGRRFDVPHPEYLALPLQGRTFFVFDKLGHIEVIDVLLVTSIAMGPTSVSSSA
jgi:hypothetical protein